MKQGFVWGEGGMVVVQKTPTHTLHKAHTHGCGTNPFSKQRSQIPIFNVKYAGFSNICKWAISADTVSGNKNWSIEMVLLT